MTELQTMPVAAIEHGSVIDHIPAGHAFNIVRLLKLRDHKKQLSMGLNLPSQKLNLKDLIKVEGIEISPEEANQIALFAPQATISIIRSYSISQKFEVSLPKQVTGLIVCPNPRCICNHDTIMTRFYIHPRPKTVIVECHYCRKRFPQETIHEYSI